MELIEFKEQLKQFNPSYEVILSPEKAKHNIRIFYVHDLKNKTIIASITLNGDLDLNNDYKCNHKLMFTIITFFTSNAKIENTYNY